MFTIVVLEKCQNKKEILIHHLSKLKLDFKYNLLAFSNFKEMIDFCNDIKEHCIFIIDIEYEEAFSGIDAAKYINEHFFQNNIIFISEELERVCEIYELNHCYFIYLDNIQDYLEKAILKAFELYNLKHTLICIETGKKLINVDTETIIYIERIKRYSLIRFDNTIVKTKSTLDQILEQLPTYFYKCHNSYLVNFSQVKEKTKNEFVMNDGNVVPIARKYVKDMESLFSNFIVNVINK